MKFHVYCLALVCWAWLSVSADAQIQPTLFSIVSESQPLPLANGRCVIITPDGTVSTLTLDPILTLTAEEGSRVIPMPSSSPIGNIVLWKGTDIVIFQEDAEREFFVVVHLADLSIEHFSIQKKKT